MAKSVKPCGVGMVVPEIQRAVEQALAFILGWDWKLRLTEWHTAKANWLKIKAGKTSVFKRHRFASKDLAIISERQAYIVLCDCCLGCSGVCNIAKFSDLHFAPEVTALWEAVHQGCQIPGKSR